jgi:hypothetical protein
MISAVVDGVDFKETRFFVRVRVISTDGDLFFQEVSRLGKASALSAF